MRVRGPRGTVCIYTTPFLVPEVSVTLNGCVLSGGGRERALGLKRKQQLLLPDFPSPSVPATCYVFHFPGPCLALFCFSPLLPCHRVCLSPLCHAVCLGACPFPSWSAHHPSTFASSFPSPSSCYPSTRVLPLCVNRLLRSAPGTQRMVCKFSLLTARAAVSFLP